jgi:hypothetical protein
MHKLYILAGFWSKRLNFGIFPAKNEVLSRKSSVFQLKAFIFTLFEQFHTERVKKRVGLWLFLNG